MFDSNFIQNDSIDQTGGSIYFVGCELRDYNHYIILPPFVLLACLDWKIDNTMLILNARCTNNQIVVFLYRLIAQCTSITLDHSPFEIETVQSGTTTFR
jgi:hypothetical protein